MQDRGALCRFTWNPETENWIFLMEQKDQTGKWKVFAEDTCGAGILSMLLRLCRVCRLFFTRSVRGENRRRRLR